MEATAAIQRALSGGEGQQTTTGVHAAPNLMEGHARVVDVGAGRTARAAGAGRFRARSGAARAPVGPGRFVESIYTNHAGTLEYKTYIPAVYHGQALPLVVMLHGCKQNPDDFAAGTRMNALAEEYGLIVVYPRQASRANVSQCWNWFQAKDQRRDEGEPSLIAGITRTVIDEYRLDARRVYVAGLSAGGAMSAIMGTTYPDLYAAAGIHSGLAYAIARDVPSAFAAMRGQGMAGIKPDSGSGASIRNIPTIVFHGDRDTTVHPNNGDHVIAQACRAGSEPSIRPSINAEAKVSEESGHASGRAYTRRIYRDQAGERVMEQWLVHGAGHAWSGGSADGSYSDPKGPDASREMLRFFLEHAND